MVRARIGRLLLCELFELSPCRVAVLLASLLPAIAASRGLVYPAIDVLSVVSLLLCLSAILRGRGTHSDHRTCADVELLEAHVAADDLSDRLRGRRHVAAAFV
jgi:hypothetical protein